MNCNHNKPKTKPLQFKRGTARAFRNANLILLEGQPAVETDTLRLKIGNGVTRYNKLPYVGELYGQDGKSAYQLWLEAGNQGTVEQYLDSLVGPAGKSAYEIWLTVGNEGTIIDFLVDIQGKSAYDVWIDAGNKGTVQDFLNSLKGLSAYDIWISLGNTGTEQDFINSLQGKSAFVVWKEYTGKPDATEEDYFNAISSLSWGKF